MIDQCDLIKHRKDNFAARIATAPAGEETYLSVTHNGYQWTSIRLNKEEMKTVIALLKKVVKND